MSLSSSVVFTVSRSIAKSSDDPTLTLPHPHAHERAFVLVPWLDVDAGAELTGHGPVADLVSRVGQESVRARGDVELRLPE